nr:reverse transcriptase domain-containing protein [Tanacetum cinerariifolium]
MEDASDEPLIIEAVVEGYLVRRVYVDQGALVKVMFEHCFENLSPAIRSRLRDTQMDLVGFAGGVDGPTIHLSGFLNNTLHGKVPHPKVVATLVTRSAVISECQRLERKQMVEQEVNQNINQEKGVPERVDLTEQTLVNPAYPDNNRGKPVGVMVVDTSFQSQIGINLEAYVDDMVIKSNNENVLIEDIVETLDNLRRINMKLNTKKCSFGVEEGKFLGYMVTSEGKWANQKKTKAIADMPSPRTLKEMQSLSEKLATLKRFLSRSAKKSLPFFETLKDIMNKNKDEYRWTENAEKAFQEIKKVIVELPLLTTPVKEETLYVYIAAATKAVSAVLLVERKGIQCPIHYVSWTLNEAEMNYAPLEKLALSLLHMSKRLRSAMKGQVLADFLPEAPAPHGKKDEGSKHRRKGGLEAGSESGQQKLRGKQHQHDQISGYNKRMYNRVSKLSPSKTYPET